MEQLFDDYRKLLRSTLHDLGERGLLVGADKATGKPDPEYIDELTGVELDNDWMKECERVDTGDPQEWLTVRTPEEEFARLDLIRRGHRSKRRKLPEVDAMTFLRSE